MTRKSSPGAKPSDKKKPQTNPMLVVGGVGVVLLMLFAFRAGKEENAPREEEPAEEAVASKAPAERPEERKQQHRQEAPAPPGLRIATQEEQQARKATVLEKEEEDRVERHRLIDAGLAQWGLGNRYEGEVENATTGVRTPIVLTVVGNQGRGDNNSGRVMLRAEGDRPGLAVLLEGKHEEYRSSGGSKSRYERYREANLHPTLSFVRVFVQNRPRRRARMSFFDPVARFTLSKNDQGQLVGQARHRYKRDQTENFTFRPTSPVIGFDLKRQWIRAMKAGSVLAGVYEEPKRPLHPEQSLRVRCEVQAGKRDEECLLTFSCDGDRAEYFVRLGPERNIGTWYAIGSLQKPSDNKKGRSQLLHGSTSRGVPLAMRMTNEGNLACLVGPNGSMVLTPQGSPATNVQTTRKPLMVQSPGVVALGLAGETRQSEAARQSAQQAAGELRTAKMFLRSSKPLVIEKGRDRLRQLVAKYPDTKAAEEAKRLLKGGAA